MENFEGNSDCEYGDEVINSDHCVPNSGEFASAAPLPGSPFRTWMVLAVMAVLRCATPSLSQPVHAPTPQGADPNSSGSLSPDQNHLPVAKVPERGLYDVIRRVCGKAGIPAVGEIAAKLPDLGIRQTMERGFAGSLTFYTDLPSNMGDGGPDDYSYSTMCFSEELGQPALPIRKFIVSRRRGPTAADLLEQWHVYDGRVMTDKQREFLVPEKFSDHFSGRGFEIPGVGFLGGGWGKHETFDHCPMGDYADIFDTPLCPTIEDIEELNQ